MEQKAEETVANEAAEFRRRDCNIPMNPGELELRSMSASPSLGVSSRSNWPGSSTLTHFDASNHHSLNRGDVFSTDVLRRPYLRNDVGFRVEEPIDRNVGYHDTYAAGCSSSKKEVNYEGEWSGSIGCTGQNSRTADEELKSDNKDSLEACSRKELKRVFMSLHDVKVSPSNHMNMVSSISTNVMEHPSSIISGNRSMEEISVDVIDGPNNTNSSNRLIRDLSSSSFSNFFLGRSQSAMRNAPYGNPRKSNGSQTMPMVHHISSSTSRLQNENVLRYPSVDASDALMDLNSLGCKLHSHDIVRKELELPHCGINLREWLESKGVDASKNDKMLLFKQIVQIVNAAHSQGIALLELRPSSFILFDSGDVKYIGSETGLWSENQDNAKKRSLETGAKMQKLGSDKLVMRSIFNSLGKVQDLSSHEGVFTGKSWLTSQNAQLEKNWYAFPEGFKTRDLLSLNIYSLGLLLFEFLCHFESIEAHSTAMLDLQNRILPPTFLSRNHEEAGFCFWLLHPQPSSRPTTREILQSGLINGVDTSSASSDEASCIDMVDDVESDLLLHFLVTLKEDKHNKASNLLEILNFLDCDIKMVERGQTSGRYLDMINGGYDTNLKDQFQSSYSSISKINVLRDKLLDNMNELENAYFSVRSNQQDEICDMTRLDKDVLRKRDHLSWVGTRRKLVTTEEKCVDPIGTFFDGICKFARYDKFEVCGILRNGDILNSNNVICSMCFDPEGDYIAAAGVSKKIKIFELRSLLNDFVDVQYPVLEMSNKSKISCICWNNYIKNYLASTDYDGVVQIWDASTGQEFGQYKEHQKRAWSVDFSRVDPKFFASGGDDCSLKTWSINERNSTGTIWNLANICSVQFSSYSSHLLAFGSADYRIYCYDLRHTRIPWCTLAGHDNAVSYVRFLDSETIVSASTDNTLKLWDLKATTLDGLSPHASTLTFRGHTNDKNFVGLAVSDGYIACGSETNEVYAYYRSLPMPISCHKFGSMDPISGYENGESSGAHFVSSVCWRRKSQMIAAANSSGTIKILRLAKSSNDINQPR